MAKNPLRGSPEGEVAAATLVLEASAEAPTKSASKATDTATADHSTLIKHLQIFEPSTEPPTRPPSKDQVRPDSGQAPDTSAEPPPSKPSE